MKKENNPSQKKIIKWVAVSLLIALAIAQGVYIGVKEYQRSYFEQGTLDGSWRIHNWKDAEISVYYPETSQGHMLIAYNNGVPKEYRGEGYMRPIPSFVPGQYIVRVNSLLLKETIYTSDPDKKETYQYVGDMSVEVYDINDPDTLVKTIDCKRILAEQFPEYDFSTGGGYVVQYEGEAHLYIEVRQGWFANSKGNNGTLEKSILVRIADEYAQIVPSQYVYTATGLTTIGRALMAYGKELGEDFPFYVAIDAGWPDVVELRLIGDLTNYDSALCEMFPQLKTQAAALGEYDTLRIYLYDIESVEELAALIDPY